jgi:hypothetical protein
MTKEQAEILGWEFSGTDSDATAEKGRVIHMGKIELVLMMIAKLEGT